MFPQLGGPQVRPARPLSPSLPAGLNPPDHNQNQTRTQTHTATLPSVHITGKDEARGQLDSALQDVNVRYAVLEETEKRAVCRALIEERARYCGFVSMLKPVLDHEINMLGEVTHLQTILEDLTNLTAEPNKLPAASEQVILDLKGSDFNYTYQTPPASPSNTMSRKSSISSNYQSVRHVPSLDSISCAVDGVHIQRCSSPYLLIGCDETGRSLSEGNSPSRLGRQAAVVAMVTPLATGPGLR
nr:protein MTSS 1-like [Labrus bergylta]